MKAIEFENIGKQYRLGLVSSGTISHDLNRWWTMNVLRKEDPYLKIGETNDRSHRGNSDYVWALKDINFSVEEGDVVGIIGKNGAGKSTLLKLLSRVTAPTTGTIRARGRIASLLEVGTGFHPEMTGRENIYMNGAIMGMTKAEITRKLDEIVDFSGCERYIDTPVKRYSSGMTVRLGFAIAAHLEPEILVVDEVLAVGDAEFQKKAIGKMQDVSKGEGRTVLFVSHNMDAMLNLCKKGILLKNGQVSFSGLIQNTVEKYLGNKEKHIFEQAGRDKKFYISKVYLRGNEQQQNGMFSFDQQLTFSIEFSKHEELKVNPQLVGSVGLFNSRMINICNVELPLSALDSKQSITYTLSYPSSIILPGKYRIFASVHLPNITMYDKQETCSFVITDNGTEYLKYGRNVDNGVIMLRPQIIFE